MRDAWLNIIDLQAIYSLAAVLLVTDSKIPACGSSCCGGGARETRLTVGGSATSSSVGGSATTVGGGSVIDSGKSQIGDKVFAPIDTLTCFITLR